MKRYTEGLKMKLTFLLSALLFTVYAFAQDDATTTTGSVTKTSTSTTSTDWYTAPWVWIVGAVLFILLLAAIIGGSRSTNVERSTTVVHRDIDA